MYKRFDSISKWDLKKYDWFKCRFEDDNKWVCEWEIYIEDDAVYIVSNNEEYAWMWYRKDWYYFSWVIYSREREDNFSIKNSYNYIEIDIPEEKEEFVRGERVLVRYNDYEECEDRIYLATIEWSYTPYVVVSPSHEEEFKNWEKFLTRDYSKIKKILKEVKITSDTWETIEISKEKAKELWFTFSS